MLLRRSRASSRAGGSLLVAAQLAFGPGPVVELVAGLLAALPVQLVGPPANLLLGRRGDRRAANRPTVLHVAWHLAWALGRRPALRGFRHRLFPFSPGQESKLEKSDPNPQGREP